LWPEVPAAFCLVEAVRGVRARRVGRWVPAMAGMVLLKLRFALVVVPLALRAVRTRRQAVVAAALVVVAVVAGAHRLWELVPRESPRAYVVGLFGLALDGAAGIAFQAPLYLFGLIALARWRAMPEGFRLGVACAALYVLVLVPRPEWHGGWSPPLRYVVFLMPFLALGAAALYERIAPAPLAIVTAWTMALTIHGAAMPWRLFHIANGENEAGEWLSSRFHADFSRLFPSFIRPNFAALVAAVVLVITLVIFRSGRWLRPAIVTVAIAAAAYFGMRPGDRVDFEDAHVIHHGGAMFPEEYQVARFVFSGGWLARPGDSMSFLAKRGPAHLRYSAEGGATIQIGARAFVLPSTPPDTYFVVPVFVDRQGRVELRCLAGTVNLDWMRHD
jgi:hypothetical protein